MGDAGGDDDRGPLQVLSSSDALSCVKFNKRADANPARHCLATGWDGGLTLCCTDDPAANVRLMPPGTGDSPMALLSCCFTDNSTGHPHGAAAGLSGDVQIVDVSSGSWKRLGAHSKPVRCLEYSLEKSLVISGGWDGIVKAWDSRADGSGKESMVAEIAPGEKVFSMDLLESKQQLLVARAGRTTSVYDLRMLDRDPLVETRPPALDYQTRCARFFPDGCGFAIGCSAGRVAVDYFEDGRKMFKFKCHRSAEKIYPVNAVAFHPVHGTFATGGGDKIVSIWDAANQRRLHALPAFSESIAALDFSADGEHLAIAVSYTFEDGDHPERDSHSSISIHTINDAMVRPRPKKTNK